MRRKKELYKWGASCGTTMCQTGPDDRTAQPRKKEKGKALRMQNICEKDKGPPSEKSARNMCRYKRLHFKWAGDINWGPGEPRNSHSWQWHLLDTARKPPVKASLERSFNLHRQLVCEVILKNKFLKIDLTHYIGSKWVIYLLGLLFASRQWAAALQPNVARDIPLQQLHFFPDHSPGW